MRREEFIPCMVQFQQEPPLEKTMTPLQDFPTDNLYRYFRKRLHGRQADDLTQDCLLSCWRSWSRGERNWHNLVQHAFQDCFRRRKIFPTESLSQDVESWESPEHRERIREIVSDLVPRDQIVVELVLSGQRPRQIAKLLRIGLATLYRRLAEIRETLREKQ